MAGRPAAPQSCTSTRLLAHRLPAEHAAVVGAHAHRLAFDARAHRLALAADAETVAARHQLHRVAGGKPLALLQVGQAHRRAGRQRPCQRAPDQLRGIRQRRRGRRRPVDLGLLQLAGVQHGAGRQRCRRRPRPARTP